MSEGISHAGPLFVSEYEMLEMEGPALSSRRGVGRPNDVREAMSYIARFA
ncbi:hypothetical protein P355_5327 [Burkholderia cenocepacia KC-01]|nr:hypothetical protein P355_5327 [Burkholderia cenocepacia KC-01]